MTHPLIPKLKHKRQNHSKGQTSANYALLSNLCSTCHCIVKAFFNPKRPSKSSACFYGQQNLVKRGHHAIRWALYYNYGNICKLLEYLQNITQIKYEDPSHFLEIFLKSGDQEKAFFILKITLTVNITYLKNYVVVQYTKLQIKLVKNTRVRKEADAYYFPVENETDEGTWLIMQNQYFLV